MASTDKVYLKKGDSHAEDSSNPLIPRYLPLLRDRMYLQRGNKTQYNLYI